MSPRGHLPGTLRRLVAAIVVSVYAALTLFGSALVLCAEEDGGVNVEWRGADCCARVAPCDGMDDRPGTPTVAAPDTDEGCGTCTDAPAIEILAVRTSRQGDLPSAPATAQPVVAATEVSVSLPRTAPATAPRAGPHRAPAPPPPLAALRTVVLRC